MPIIYGGCQYDNINRLKRENSYVVAPIGGCLPVATESVVMARIEGLVLEDTLMTINFVAREVYTDR